MKFDEWLKGRKLTSSEFARLAGLPGKQLVHKYRHGERFPTAENLRRIRVATEGEVTADDFVDQHAPPQPLAPAPAAPKSRGKRAAPGKVVKPRTSPRVTSNPKPAASKPATGRPRIPASPEPEPAPVAPDRQAAD